MENKWGTVVFDRDFMEQTIRVDMALRTIMVDAWMDKIPDVYQERCAIGVQEIGSKYVNRKLTTETVAEFRDELRVWIENNIEPAPFFTAEMSRKEFESFVDKMVGSGIMQHPDETRDEVIARVKATLPDNGALFPGAAEPIRHCVKCGTELPLGWTPDRCVPCGALSDVKRG